MASRTSIPRLLFAVCLATATSVAYADLVPVDDNTSFDIYLNTDTYRPFDYCEGETPGGTRLRPIEFLSRDSALIGNIRDVLSDQYSVRVVDGWWGVVNSFNIGSETIPGTLVIDSYRALDTEIGDWCQHGADISLNFNYTGEELSIWGLQEPVMRPMYLTWITIDSDWLSAPYPETDWFVPSGVGAREGHPDDEQWASEEVFYSVLVGCTGYYTPYDWARETEPWLWEPFSAQQIQIYDGIVWGYEAECIVPEPATWLLLVLGLGGLAAKRRMQVR